VIYRYIVIVNGNGIDPVVFDTERKEPTASYPTTALAEIAARALNLAQTGPRTTDRTG